MSKKANKCRDYSLRLVATTAAWSSAWFPWPFSASHTKLVFALTRTLGGQLMFTGSPFAGVKQGMPISLWTFFGVGPTAQDVPNFKWPYLRLRNTYAICFGTVKDILPVAFIVPKIKCRGSYGHKLGWSYEVAPTLFLLRIPFLPLRHEQTWDSLASPFAPIALSLLHLRGRKTTCTPP